MIARTARCTCGMPRRRAGRSARCRASSHVLRSSSAAWQAPRRDQHRGTGPDRPRQPQADRGSGSEKPDAPRARPMRATGRLVRRPATGAMRPLDAATMKSVYTWTRGRARSSIQVRRTARASRRSRGQDADVRHRDARGGRRAQRPAATQAAFSPDRRSTANNSDFLRAWPAFPNTQDFFGSARSVMLRRQREQRQDFSLDASETAPQQ